MRFGSFALLMALLPLAAGCGSDPVRLPPPSAEPPVCDDPQGYVDLSYPPLDVGKVTATVLTPDGKPANHVLVAVCGINACTQPEYTGTSGVATLEVDYPTQKPAFKYGDAYAYGELAVLFPGDEGGTDLGNVYAPPLPAVGAPIAPGERAESEGVAVTLAKDGHVDLEPFAPYDTEEGRALRAAELPRDLWPEGLDHGAELELVFALAPMGAKLCPPAALEVPNSEQWAPGTEVEFYVQGLDAGVSAGAQLFAPYGEWQKIGTGTVDVTGEALVLESGGLPVITNIGVRRP